MDELKIKLSTKLMRGIVSKLLSKMICTKLGCKVNISLNELDVSVTNGIAHIHANLDGNMKQEDLMNIIKANLE